jgi:hypothetical protein
MHLELFNPIYAFDWYGKKGENFSYYDRFGVKI